MSDEATLTFISTLTGQSESIPMPLTTNVQQVTELCQALFGVDSPITLLKDGTALYPPTASLQSLQVTDGDVLAVQPITRGGGTSTASSRASAAAPRTATSSNNRTGGLDFSSLLSPAPPAPPTEGGGLDFGTLLGGGGAAATTTASSEPPEPTYYKGMNLNEAIAYNPHPRTFIRLLQSKDHLFKELNYYRPALADKLRNQPLDQAVEIWRDYNVKGGIQQALHNATKFHTEQEMTRRLQANADDTEANEYFREQKRKEKVDEQYAQVMQEYPEAMGRVLMLYITCKINNHEIQAFCDSGAQTTIMSKKVAIECGLEDYIDTQFQGMATGVGTGKILGRIHIVQLQIGNYFFPCSVSVMDDPTGGASEMPFLLGLDMMKRHTCIMDFGTGVIKFRLAPGEYLETSFLHEKDLDESKGGTKGFDVVAANKKFIELKKKDEDGDVEM